MVADLHCHPSLPALNTRFDMWNYQPPTADERSKLANTTAVNGFTQGDYTSLCKAKACLVFHSLYPVEQGFLCSKVPILKIDDKESFFGKLWRLVAKDIDSGGRDRFLRRVLSKIIYNMTGDRFREITSEEHSYFEDLKKEHQKFVTQAAQHKTVDGIPANLEVIQSYQQLRQLLNINANYEIDALARNKVGVIFSVEGGHSLGCGQKNSVLKKDGISLIKAEDEKILLDDENNEQTKAHIATITANIRSLKKMGPKGMDDDGSHCPFYITFNHHFWNQLCGSAMSYADPANKVLDQLNGLTSGFTRVGRIALDELLSKENGKRILIDIKHMSHEGRQFYYKHLAEKYPGENIPVIASHMGVNGLAAYDALSYPASANINDPAAMDDAYKKSRTLFNIWDINLFDDDIINIHVSGGIIGLNFDQRILAGKLQVDNMTSVTNTMFSREILRDRDDDVDSDDEAAKIKDIINSVIYRSIWAQPIVDNIWHIIKTIINSNKGNVGLAWERVCIGSDFDGVINALDAYCHAEDFLVLRSILIQKFNMLVLSEPLLENRNIEELVDGFMYKNLLKFLERNF